MNTDRLRFRIWDNELKEYVEYSAHDSVRMCLHPDGDMGYLYHDEEIRKISQEESYVVEQCTGLKDRDGKLIYEGDILLSSDGSNYSVEYDLHYARFLRRGKFNNAREFLADLNSSMAENFLRVVGNIHENPELLEGKK